MRTESRNYSYGGIVTSEMSNNVKPGCHVRIISFAWIQTSPVRRKIPLSVPATVFERSRLSHRISRTLIKDPPYRHISHDSWNDRVIQYYRSNRKIVTPVVTEHILEKFLNDARIEISLNQSSSLFYHVFIILSQICWYTLNTLYYIINILYYIICEYYINFAVN